MRRALLGVTALATLLACACGNAPTASSPHSASHDFARKIADATRLEATGDATRATGAWLDLLDAAVSAPDDSWALATELAAVDALTERSIPALDEASADVALVGRVNDGSFGPAPSSASIAGRIARAFERADDPFSKGTLARALDTIATHRGDATEAAKWRTATGCANAATIVGPLGWTSVTGVTDDTDPLAKADAKIDASYPTPGAFSRASAPVVFSGRGCAIDPGAIGAAGGTRDVVVDVKVDHAQTIGVSLRARSAAALRVGGHVVLLRPYALGNDETVRFARVDVPGAGTLRLVARVGMEDEGEAVEIAAWGEHGAALTTRAPAVGEAGNVAVASSRAVDWPSAKGDVERAALAVAALAAGERSTAEDVTSSDAARTDASPELLLAYARAVEQADDLDSIHSAERARGAYERVLEAWPGSWEAIAAHAELAGVRRGQSEQRIWTLRDLDDVRAKAAGAIAEPATLDALEAAIAGHDRLFDRAKTAFDRATKSLSGTALLRDVERAVHERTGAERGAFECSASAPEADRGKLQCFEALRAAGDRTKATAELDRVRALYGSPSAYLAITLRDAIAVGDADAASRAFSAMLPGEKTLSASYAVDGGSNGRKALLALAPIARDAPAAFSSLFRASGDDPGAPFAGIAERITAEDRAHPILPGAATAVLTHVERYDVAPDGLVRFVLFDVRRVTTTTDVEENAQADPPDVSGRTTMHIVRRRIFKKDGRVVEPDRTPGAAQSHADLSQLERGDAIEAIYEGWTLPGERGDVTIDTPDLLPDRTAVHDATIELRVPSCAAGTPCAQRASSWAHPLLGKATESREGDTRVLRWTLKDAGERRIEDGTPRMDRDVGVSFSTATWADTARALRETMASLDGSSPEVRAWALDATKGAAAPGVASQRAMVDAIVEAAGKSVKEANASLLSDLEIGRPQGGRQLTARSILANHEGSRTWLIVRALRDLGIDADVAIAENEPFSAVADFPPHDGRFVHPLVIARPKDGGKSTDVWIDADVAGPPLPAGRVSPELRGRAVLMSDGRIAPVPPVESTGESDEVDVRLTVDDHGDAKGTLMVLLRGRAAQELAEALHRIVGDERQRMLRGVALAWVPFADVDEALLSSTEGSWQVAIRASLTIPGFAQQVSDAHGKARRWIIGGIHPIHSMFPRSVVATLSATYASQGARKDALAISRAEQYHVRRRVELPPGAMVARAPGALSVDGSILSAVRKVSVAANVLEDDFTLSVATGTVRADAYPAFAADAHKIDDGFLASTLVSPAP